MNLQQGVVLIVDDEQTVLESLRRAMEQAGHVVTTAASGEEALEVMSQREFAVVLLDVKMPGLSGIDVLHKLHQEHPDTSVIMATVVTDIHTVIEAMKLGAYDYISKPFNLDDVVLKVAKALERRNLVLQNKEYQHHLEEMVEEQRARLQRQFVELIQSLAREHALVYERETSRGRKRGRQEPLEQLPPELRKPISSVQEFAAALLRIIEEGRMLRDKGSEKVT